MEIVKWDTITASGIASLTGVGVYRIKDIPYVTYGYNKYKVYAPSGGGFTMPSPPADSAGPTYHMDIYFPLAYNTPGNCNPNDSSGLNSQSYSSFESGGDSIAEPMDGGIYYDDATGDLCR